MRSRSCLFASHVNRDSTRSAPRLPRALLDGIGLKTSQGSSEVPNRVRRATDLNPYPGGVIDHLRGAAPFQAHHRQA